jgi:predicted nucleic acid-binding Zn ribbon protein
MAELLNHRHCKNCERAVPYGEELCSDACRTQWAAFQKKRQRTVLFFYVASALLLILLLMQLLGRF